MAWRNGPGSNGRRTTNVRGAITVGSAPRADRAQRITDNQRPSDGNP